MGIVKQEILYDSDVAGSEQANMAPDVVKALSFTMEVSTSFGEDPIKYHVVKYCHPTEVEAVYLALKAAFEAQFK